MDGMQGPHLCFPHLNSSCKKVLRPRSETALLYTLMFSISLITVLLNLLVIISISHFRQLHTPSNTLLLSLAVSDLLVGLVVMPIEGSRYTESCWLLGKLICALSPYVSYCLLSGSVSNMVLISIDRYVAICDPLVYPYKITLTRVKILICFSWLCAVLYNAVILMGHLRHPDRYSSCHGECVVVISHISGTVDLFLTFIAPCATMVFLYVRVFAVAVAQARAMQSHVAAVASATAVVRARRSERKAAKTLGIVILVFLMCFCPYFYPSLAGEDTSNSLTYFAMLSWIMMLNSCMNPLIYAMCYPWFRKAVKYIITLKILQPDSHNAIILSAT
ncbi:trace amine-associated receptor 13c-like [Myripristis murdjan]|uniref:trace amine-associated receptor 13c-like n=1 Tax=Myripristis murdjan TaxID=586833 RepID=UPI0011763703|nr:trace amine-associated receptor 13c-like [Myripristis murdjan]